MFALVALCVAPVFAGELVVQTRLPVEVVVDGVHHATLLSEAELALPIESGPHAVQLWVGGVPKDLEVLVPVEGSAAVVIGRTGVTTTTLEPAPEDPAATAAVELRATGGESVVVVIDDERHTVDPGGAKALLLAPGEHDLSLRNTKGTVIWADGVLVVPAGGAVVVHLADGRAPEVIGRGSVFRPTR